MALVLIVEDEPILRSSVARGLAKLPGVEVVTAGTVEDAVRLIDFSPPALVVSDLDLPDRAGVELLTELEQRQVRAPVLFVSAYVGAFRSRIPRRANVETFEKPVPIERLRELVRTRLAAAPTEEDDAPFTLDEYLQLACMGRHSILLRAELGGRRIGELVVWSGELRSASDAQGSGPDAFRRIASAMIGRAGAHLVCRTLRAEPSANDMHGAGWQGLLLDSIRERDERAARGEPEPPLTEEAPPPERVKVPKPSATSTSRTFDRLYEEGVDALLGKRFQEALAAFQGAEALEPGDPRVIANVRRLREMGYGSDT